MSEFCSLLTNLKQTGPVLRKIRLKKRERLGRGSRKRNIWSKYTFKKSTDTTALPRALINVRVSSSICGLIFVKNFLRIILIYVT